MENKIFDIPPSTTLPGAAHLGDIALVMVDDTAFTLKLHLMRPFPGQKLSKDIENAFGILAT